MEGTTSSNGADSYMTILSKRIRAYKKIIERINVLKDKKDLEPEQKELCSHLEVYTAILKELEKIKAQFLQLHPEVVPETTPNCDSPAVEEAPSEVAEAVEVENKQAEPVGESVIESVVEETPMDSREESPAEPREEPPVESKDIAQPLEAETTSPNDTQPTKKPEMKKHYSNHRRGPNDDHRPRFHRGGRNPMNKRNPRPNISRKDREDGWTIPKKVVHVKN